MTSTPVLRSITTHQLSLPLPQGREVKTALHTVTGAEVALVQIEDDSGAIGIGYAMTFRRTQTAAVRLMIHDLVLSLHPEIAPRSQWQRLLTQLDFTGKAGVGMMALAAIDTALWDLQAQRAGMPLYRYLGSDRREIPVYVPGGWISYSLADVQDEARRYQNEGFSRYKIKIGHPDGWREDLHRVQSVQQAVGSDMEIYVDANQSWNRTDAEIVGRGLQDLGVVWYEEPIAAEDLFGSAELARTLDVPVVVGQSAHFSELKSLIDLRAGDILMPDFMRCGGITGWLDIATLAAASHLPVTSHAFSEINAHLMSACPNALVAEYFPRWFDSLYDEPLQIDAGRIRLSDRPGLGLVVTEKAQKKFSVDNAPHTIKF